MSFDEILSLRGYVLFYPAERRKTARLLPDEKREVLGRQMQQVGIELHIARLAIVADHQLTEPLEEFLSALSSVSRTIG